MSENKSETKETAKNQVDAEHDKNPAPIVKHRYWWAVLYPENMVDDWEARIDDIVQVPYAYCVHDMDTDAQSEHRKDHVHLILAFPNTTTYNHALSVFRLLGAKAVNTCEAVIRIRHAYEYLIHNTDSCRKMGKHEYSPDLRIEGNGFDIGAYEQLSTADKQAMLKELVGYVINRGFTTINDFTVAALSEYGDQYWDVIVGYNGTLERYCRGNYLKQKQADERAEKRQNAGFQTHQEHHQTHETHGQTHENRCPDCGSGDVKRKGKTSSGLQRYVCRECGKSFSQ